ncbi:MAG: hypothetical protein BAJATHORv1_60007 [Candidatus Thorarchaeota archaeon]|nr:MAG: hypothetical protein BAJATHORv1_60007 [Candidatus Thorarchaeota archaeon]
MGGFFLTNNIAHPIERNVMKLLEKKSQEVVTYNLGEFRLYYFRRVNTWERESIFEQSEDKIFGIGTIIYKNRVGTQALKHIYQDLIESNHDLGILNDIKGHYNIILYIDRELSVITDRIGAYHSFVAKEEDSIFISSSLFAIAENLHSLSIRKQEIMEFIASKAFYGPTTIFEEITFLPFGHVHKMKSSNFASFPFHQDMGPLSEYTLEDHMNRIRSHLKPLKELQISITADISGGYDSRLVCAILNHMNIDYTLSTNTNSQDSLDLKIASLIAKGEDRPLVVYEKNFDRNNYETLIDNSIFINELFRGAYGSEYSHIFFSEKTRDFDMILGGYGGELYRDTKYKGIADYEELIRKKYVHRDLDGIFSHDDIELLHQDLKRKMSGYVTHNNNELSKMDCERIYYYQRMMYWGGARVNIFNAYGLRYHPLLEYEVIHPLFYIDDSEKGKGKFLMQLMEKFDPRLASYPSGYGHNFIWSEYEGKRELPNIINVPLNLLFKVYRKITQRHTTVTLDQDRSVWHKKMKNHFLIEKLFDQFDARKSEKYLSTIYSVEEVLRTFQDKIECFG